MSMTRQACYGLKQMIAKASLDINSARSNCHAKMLGRDVIMSISKVFEYCLGQVINPNSAWYLTRIKGRFELFSKNIQSGFLLQTSEI